MLRFEGLVIDTVRREVRREGSVVDLTGTEWELLCCWRSEPQRVWTATRSTSPPARQGSGELFTRGRHPGQPAGEEAGAAAGHQDAAQRRLPSRGART